MIPRFSIRSLFFIASVWIPAVAAGAPSLTIYNNEFAVVRESLPLQLKKGTVRIQEDDITAHMEPSSVILRDPADKVQLRILEQNYHDDPASQGMLLSLYEGQELDFLVKDKDGERTVRGRVIRSGYVPHYSGLSRFGQNYAQRQYAMATQPGAASAIVEVDGKLRFELPGTPLFPGLKDRTILKPTVDWLLESDHDGRLDAELSYMTGGLAWGADYNIVAAKKDGPVSLTGWVSIDNQSGRSFMGAKLKLMAGDVNKIRTDEERARMVAGYSAALGSMSGMPQVSEKPFDEYHLYSIQRPVDLQDRETKQVEFVRASGIKAQRRYIYDGMKISESYRSYGMSSIRGMQDYGTLSNPKVWVMREFRNAADNKLGIPLPAGRLRFFTKDDDGQLEMTGESLIAHTPADETVRVFTGNAFDIVGERRQTHFFQNQNEHLIQENFEIKLRNRKKEEIEVSVVEHLYRGYNWEIMQESSPYKKTDSQTVEFQVKVPPGGEEKLTYSVNYRW